MNRKPYPSDLTDEQWALLEELIPPARPGGCPRKHDMREVLNALFYLTREGCSWRALPQDRKSTRLNSSHVRISYAVFCLKKKKKNNKRIRKNKKHRTKIQ